MLKEELLNLPHSKVAVEMAFPEPAVDPPNNRIQLSEDKTTGSSPKRSMSIAGTGDGEGT
jgi:hypothetical protein